MTKCSFSALARTQQLAIARDTPEFDVLVIGGGITGAGIALDAAARGFRTCLVEADDFAGGTSSRSTKLVHGGLRYLKQLEIGLVREVGLERAVVHRNARHIVLPERMLLPIVQGGSLGIGATSLALWVYDWLAGVPKSERRRMLNAQQTAEQEPLLNTAGLKGGGLYYEYRTDDARLTIEVLKTAAVRGALCLNYVQVERLLTNDRGAVCGVGVQDRLEKQCFDLRARMVVNAAGPWVDAVRGLDAEGVKGKRLLLTKGIHAVVPYERLPLQQSAYFDVPGDKRMIFAIPRGQVTYLGTTDTHYTDDLRQPVATRDDVVYLLDAVNKVFPSVRLALSDVESSWAGLRPLIHQDGKSPSELSRKDEIFVSRTGLVSIAGGKLTGYRRMAERVMDLVSRQLGVLTHSTTRDMPLSGCTFDSQASLDRFIVQRCGEVREVQIEAPKVVELALRYGANLDTIVEKAFEWYHQYPDPVQRIEAAEMWYCIEHEMCHNLCDYLIRRTGRLYFERPATQQHYPQYGDLMAGLLDWPEQRKYRELAAFQRELDAVTAFRRPPTTTVAPSTH